MTGCKLRCSPSNPVGSVAGTALESCLTFRELYWRTPKILAVRGGNRAGHVVLLALDLQPQVHGADAAKVTSALDGQRYVRGSGPHARPDCDSNRQRSDRPCCNFHTDAD